MNDKYQIPFTQQIRGGDPPYMTSVFAGGDLWDTYIEVKRFEEYTKDIDMPSSMNTKCRQ